MPKIILKFPKHKLTGKLSLADILRVKKILNLGFDIDWEEIIGGKLKSDKRMDRERD